MTTVSIVIPAHNEEANIKKTITEVLKIFPKNKLKGEIIAVDDRSLDKTGKILDSMAKKNRLVKVVHRTGGVGVEIGYAIRDGIKHAKCDVVVIMMGDLSDDPNDVAKMVEKIDEGYDVVCGSRFIKGSEAVDYPPLKLISNRLYNIFFSVFFGVKSNDFSNAFKAYRRSIFKKVNLESKGFESNAELGLKAHFLGYKMTDVPVKWLQRKRGKSKMGSFSFSPKSIFIQIPMHGLNYGLLALRLFFRYKLKEKIRTGA
jgi:glycosyltransferase involved in cell wall biosynthesis